MVDVLIIGAGLAGISAAIGAKRDKKRVLVVSKALPTSSQSVMAQGGINIALGNIEDDSIDLHISDTLKAAKGLANEEMVERMCKGGVEAAKFLEEIGVPFSRVEGANDPIKSIAQRKLGGASRVRACYAQDYTGLKLLHTLYDYALKIGVEFKSDLYLLDLINSDGEIGGGYFLDSNCKVLKVDAKATILATGGYGGVYYNYTTNMHSTTGDGIAAAIRAGGFISGAEFVQFHPTALKSSCVLISESARGEGGYLVNSDNERFVDELKPRDEVARAIFNEINRGKEVFLDLRHIDSQKILSLLPQEAELCRFYEGVDITKELVPIKSVAHYSMGGIAVDEDFFVEGLNRCLAVGECSNAKVHGANRLGGNSLLEVIVFGLRAGEVAIGVDGEIIDKEIDFRLPFNGDTINIYTLKEELGELMFSKAGIVRDKEGLEELIDSINRMIDTVNSGAIRDRATNYNQELIEYLELKNALLVAKAVAIGALRREESRGAHYRSDYPNIDEAFRKDIKLNLKDLQ